MALQCPLDPSKTFTSMKWKLNDIKKIEYHVKTAAKRCQHLPLEDLVVTGLRKNERSTPLLMACEHGDLKAVQRIVERWGIDVSTAAVHCTAQCSYTEVEGLTPLFVAAFYCHSNIVQYLVEKGADVNSRTHSADKGYSGMTPLYAATVLMEDGDSPEEKTISTIRLLLESGADPSPLIDDGRPFWCDVLIGIQITALLVEWGMDLNHRIPDSGNTVLHTWVDVVDENRQDESLRVVRMLVEKGADLQARNYQGLSVILVAAIGDYDRPNLPVLEYLLDRNEISRNEKIDALETVGAVILGYDGNHEKFPLAFQYWRRALILRLMDTQDCHPIYKAPLNSKSGQLSEWTTLDDIRQIEQDPTRREIQAILVLLRIFAGLSQKALNYYMGYVLLAYLENEVDNDHTFDQMMDISLTAMDVIFRYDPIESELRSSTSDVISKLISTFCSLPNDDPNFNSTNLKTFVVLVAKMDQLHLPDANQKIVADTNHIENLKNLVSILSRRPDLFTNEMKLSLVHMVRRDVSDSSGFNVLLIACRKPDFETLSTVRLLVKLKVNTNAVNNVGDSPLHLLAMVLVNSGTRDAKAHLLLKSGAHLDMVNKEGMTAADLWLKKSKENGKSVDWRELPDWLQEGVPCLKCLCSRVIQRHRLPYDDEAILPAVLIPFVSLH